MVEDDGVGLPEGSSWPFNAKRVEHQKDKAGHGEGQLDTRGKHGEPGMGGSIVAALAKSLGAELDVSSATVGTMVTLDLEDSAPTGQN